MRTALVVTLAAGCVRLAIAGLTPLFPDETYYWEWSRHLAAGYFDHPPMIAWIIAAGTALAGDTPLGVRLAPVLAGIGAGVIIAAGAHRLAGARAALVASLVFALMPLSAAGLVLATPDAPLFAAASASVYGVLRALEHPARSRASFRWWCGAGVALGLSLMSKYTGVLVPLGVFVALLARRDLRDRLGEPGPYAATAVALLVFLPVILWNADHGWASFAFQLQHGFSTAAGSALKRELDLIGGQLGLVSPILFAMMVVAAVRRADGRAAVLGILAATIFAFFMYSATQRRVEANWPALAYIPGTLLLAAHAAGHRWHSWLRSGLALAGVLTLVTYVNSFTPVLPVPARRDPVARASGWGDLAKAVNRTYSARLPISSYRTWVAADRYQEASELAFHLPDHPQTFSLNLTTRPNHYAFWPAFTDRAQPRDGLILVVDEVAGTSPTVRLLAPHFTAVRMDEMVTLAREGDPVKYLRIWVLDGWLGTWPEPLLRSRS